MTPEAQRIAIATACGWTWKPELFGIIQGPHHPSGARDVPDYPNSLDAMHEAEKVLDVHQRMSYLFTLVEICSGKGSGNGEAAFATAPQRCEAFLRTIGRWDAAVNEGEKL